MLLRSAVYLLVYFTLFLNTTTPLLGPNFHGPLVTRLKGLHCTSVDKGTVRVKISSQIKKCYAMTLVRIKIQMIESEVWHTNNQATYFLCDIDGHKIAKHKFQNHQFSFRTFFYLILRYSLTTVCERHLSCIIILNSYLDFHSFSHLHYLWKSKPVTIPQKRIQAFKTGSNTLLY